MKTEMMFVPLEATLIVTQEAVADIMRKYDADLTLVSFKMEPGTSRGDNFLSLMYAVEATVVSKSRENSSTKIISLMYKTMPRNPIRQEQIQSARLFLRESKMYEIVLPKLATSTSSSIFPKCLATSVSSHSGSGDDYIAMENLKVQG